jgi:LPPG:FO 2-phospho-L-lactate transferase
MTLSRIVVVAGGVGGARFTRGLLAALARSGQSTKVTVVVNTADDITLHGLRVCPDLDTVMYTLGDGINEAQGWGRRDEAFVLRDELTAYGSGPEWFTLGDRDLATHIMRSHMLAAGYSLTEVTAALCQRWSPGAQIVPMTNDQVETHVVIDDDDGSPHAVHFQEWWLKLRAAVPARDFVLVGSDSASPAPAALNALHDCDLVILAPSNPVVSIGTVLGIRGLRSAIVAKPVVGVSPIVGGAPVRGYADACLQAIGVETSAKGVAAHYGARAHDGLLDGWIVDERDAEAVSSIESLDIACRAVPAMMTDVDTASKLADEVLALSRSLMDDSHIGTEP